MNKKELPIGTVVMLTGGTKKVMITGYRSKSNESDRVFDYNGCIFPEGLMENIYCLFDAYQIEDVFYMGLQNEETKEQFNKLSSYSSVQTVKTEKTDSKKQPGRGKKGYYNNPPRKSKSTRTPGDMRREYGVNKESARHEQIGGY